MNRDESTAFLFATVVFFTVTYVTAALCGHLVQHHGLKTNYSRKIGHFLTIGVPWGLQHALSLDQNMVAVVLAAMVTPTHLLLFVRPIRDRVPLVATMFRSVDRPEDRPHTLKWLITQYVAVYIVYLLVYAVLLWRGAAVWMTVAIVINVIGDGLAEPVGVAFGRHAYTCRALFSRRTYQRTLEGSLCVLLSGVICIALLRHEFQPLQFWIALAVIPISGAVAEAYSPHTWDGPFLFLVIGAELVLLTFV
ncbi:MAG: hypothetical protein C0483_21730 [Pirellula sp.]|nr:hypothetical protein [Pirellula sp.]